MLECVLNFSQKYIIFKKNNVLNFESFLNNETLVTLF